MLRDILRLADPPFFQLVRLTVASAPSFVALPPLDSYLSFHSMSLIHDVVSSVELEAMNLFFLDFPCVGYVLFLLGLMRMARKGAYNFVQPSRSQ